MLQKPNKAKSNSRAQMLDQLVSGALADRFMLTGTTCIETQMLSPDSVWAYIYDCYHALDPIAVLLAQIFNSCITQGRIVFVICRDKFNELVRTYWNQR